MAVLAAALASGNSTYIGGALAFEVGSTVATAYGGKYIYDKYLKPYQYRDHRGMLRQRLFEGLSKGKRRKRSIAPSVLAGRRIYALRKARRYQNKLNRRTGGYRGRFLPCPSATDRKFRDFAYNFTQAGGTTAIQSSFTAVPQGTTYSTRIGNGICVKSITMRGNVYFAPGAAVAGVTACDTITHYLILDTECNRAEAGITDIFDTLDLSQAHMNLANSKRFRVIQKWKIAINPVAGVSGAFCGQIVPFDKYIKCSIPIKWEDFDTTGVIDNQTRNSILWVTSSTTGLSNVVCNVRVRYEDA